MSKLAMFAPLSGRNAMNSVRSAITITIEMMAGIRKNAGQVPINGVATTAAAGTMSA